MSRCLLLQASKGEELQGRAACSRGRKPSSAARAFGSNSEREAKGKGGGCRWQHRGIAHRDEDRVGPPHNPYRGKAKTGALNQYGANRDVVDLRSPAQREERRLRRW
jgi:hypothetical protein